MTEQDPKHRTARTPRPRWNWRWFLVYAGLSLIFNWPLAGSLTTHISYGHEEEITVPMLNLWTVWWNADRAAAGFRNYWNAPIFHPTKTTFIFSETQPTSVVVAPVLWLTGNRGLTYNCYQLLIIALNGYSADRLLRRIGHSPWLAFCGGTMAQILPFVTWQFGVVQLTTLFGIHWTLHCLLELFGLGHPQPDHRDAITLVDQTCQSVDQATVQAPLDITASRRKWIGLRLGLAYGVTYWLCNYWGLFLTLLFVPSSVFLWNRCMLSARFWREVAIAALVAAVMIGPFAWKQRRLSNEHDWRSARSDETIYGLSAHWRDHFDAPWQTLFPQLEFPEKDRENVWALGGGSLRMVMVPIGVIAACFTSRRRRWGLFVLTFGLIAFGLSLGPTIQIANSIPWFGGGVPYNQLKQFVPGFSLIRSPFRFALFVQLAAVLLSLEALDLLNPRRWSRYRSEISAWASGLRGSTIDTNRTDGRRGPWTFVGFFPIAIAGLALTWEVIPPAPKLYEVPSPGGIPIWVLWLRDHAEPGSPIACLPFPIGNQARDYEETTIQMYWGTFHQKPLISGYSGFFPNSFLLMKEGLEQFTSASDDSMDARFADYAPDNPGLMLLNQSTARYVVMKRAFGTRDDVWNHPLTRFRWAHIASDETEQVDIYELPISDQ